jgi:hydroxyacylglutathione hydrolase
MISKAFIFFISILISLPLHAQFSDKFSPAERKHAVIEQFEDEGLAQFSYAVMAAGKIILVDPARDITPYLEYAHKHQAEIIGVIETHPHADFVSSHLEVHNRLGATIYVSERVRAEYPHQSFDEGDEIILSPEVSLLAIFTPGHSPDGISVIVREEGKDIAVFTGDTMFIGDVGRPDLRETDGNFETKREELARALYKSTREKLMLLDDDVSVYPTHGAGSLCGKAIQKAYSSTIGQEKLSNYALQEMSEEEFVALIMEDQPFVPIYFPYNVAVNKKGAQDRAAGIEKVKSLEKNYLPKPGSLIIDGRLEKKYKTSHLPESINIMEGAKFETWLGSVVAPNTFFYLVAGSQETLDILIGKTTKIGYEPFIKGSFVYDLTDGNSMQTFEIKEFIADIPGYTILDIRGTNEVKENQIFEQAINIPLPELAKRAHEIPTDKPIVVHCGTGYRSAIGSSIIHNLLEGATVLDMGASVKDFMK